MNVLILIFSLILNYSTSVQAQFVPLPNTDPIVNLNFDSKSFDFIKNILHDKNLKDYLKCSIKTQSSHEVRTFLNGSEWVETLKIDFESKSFSSGFDMGFTITKNSKYGRHKKWNQWTGVGEEIKIELGDDYDHWIKFTHDGKGQIIDIMLGNNLRIATCARK